MLAFVNLFMVTGYKGNVAGNILLKYFNLKKFQSFQKSMTNFFITDITGKHISTRKTLN